LTRTERRNAWILVVIGLALSGGAAYLVKDTLAFVARATASPGRVVELRSHSASKGSVYRPVVRFEPDGGPERTFESSTGSNPPSYHLGEAVTVLWTPGHPEEARIQSFGDLWFGPLALGLMGLLCGVLGVVFLWRDRPATRKGTTGSGLPDRQPPDPLPGGGEEGVGHGRREGW
jgi:hypothetical protein